MKKVNKLEEDICRRDNLLVTWQSKTQTNSSSSEAIFMGKKMINRIFRKVDFTNKGCHLKQESFKLIQDKKKSRSNLYAASL